jgi:hypothetical protein
MFVRQANTTDEFPDAEFWSGVYRDHPIAVLKRGDRWHVYLDHLLLHKLAFATAAHARTWLIKRINQQRVRSNRGVIAT